MIHYNKRGHGWVSLLGAVLLLLSTGVDAKVHCPQPNAIQYDQNQARFVATKQGVTWRSPVMPALIPIPRLIADPTPAVISPGGEPVKACFYHYNVANTVVLFPPD